MHAPLRMCSGKGGRCPNRVPHGRCRDCMRKVEQQRGTSTQRGYDTRWSRYAAQWRRDYPLCGMRSDGALHVEHSQCAQRGLLAPAYAVDHIIPHKGQADPLFWSPGNHASLCASCHSRKTAIHDSTFARRA